MLDIRYIKENPQEVIERLAIKGKDAKEEIARILELDAQRRALITETEALKAEQNKTSKLIPQYKKEGKDTAEIFAQMKELSDRLRMYDPKASNRWLKRYYRNKDKHDAWRWHGKKYMREYMREQQPEMIDGEVVILI